jgi:hypothetical protein
LNNHLEEEPFIDCSECGRKNHKICALWHDGLEKAFICQACRKDKKDLERKWDLFAARSMFLILSASADTILASCAVTGLHKRSQNSSAVAQIFFCSSSFSREFV